MKILLIILCFSTLSCSIDRNKNCLSSDQISAIKQSTIYTIKDILGRPDVMIPPSDLHGFSGIYYSKYSYNGNYCILSFGVDGRYRGAVNCITCDSVYNSVMGD